MVTMVQILLTLPDQKGKSGIMQFNRDIVTLAKKNEYFVRFIRLKPKPTLPNTRIKAASQAA